LLRLACCVWLVAFGLLRLACCVWLDGFGLVHGCFRDVINNDALATHMLAFVSPFHSPHARSDLVLSHMGTLSDNVFISQNIAQFDLSSETLVVWTIALPFFTSMHTALLHAVYRNLLLHHINKKTSHSSV
jgi:hypothetical protein